MTKVVFNNSTITYSTDSMFSCQSSRLFQIFELIFSNFSNIVLFKIAQSFTLKIFKLLNVSNNTEAIDTFWLIFERFDNLTRTI